jgi:hypothetical protein
MAGWIEKLGKASAHMRKEAIGFSGLGAGLKSLGKAIAPGAKALAAPATGAAITGGHQYATTGQVTPDRLLHGMGAGLALKAPARMLSYGAKGVAVGPAVRQSMKPFFGGVGIMGSSVAAKNLSRRPEVVQPPDVEMYDPSKHGPRPTLDFGPPEVVGGTAPTNTQRNSWLRSKQLSNSGQPLPSNPTFGDIQQNEYGSADGYYHGLAARGDMMQAVGKSYGMSPLNRSLPQSFHDQAQNLLQERWKNRNFKGLAVASTGDALGAHMAPNSRYYNRHMSVPTAQDAYTSASVPDNADLGDRRLAGFLAKPSAGTTNHELSHAAQQANPKMPDVGSEMGPSLGDIVFLNETARRDGRSVNMPLYSSGGGLSSEAMRQQAANHGYFQGKSIDELLATPTGRQWAEHHLKNMNNDWKKGPVPTAPIRPVEADLPTGGWGDQQ